MSANAVGILGVPASKQQKIVQLQKRLNSCMLPARDLENGLLSTLADGVAVSIDRVKADSTIAQLSSVAIAANGCSANTLNGLHALLSASQRALLIDRVRGQAETWRQANSDAVPDSRHKGGRLGDLALELNLTADQVDRIFAALPTGLAPLGQFDQRVVDEHVQDFSAAFAQKSFDADALIEDANGLMATYGARRMMLFYATAAPLLTPGQRTILAEHLRQHAGQSPSASAI